MMLGLSLSLVGNRLLDGLDPDAAVFIAASGATEVQAINDFVVQIKNENLWPFLRCWPMRAGQNAGTGATVYGLGGYSLDNGTLVNTPLWQTNGVQFLSASTQYMTIPISSFNTTYAIGFAVTMLTNGLAGSCIMACNGTSNMDSMQINDAPSSVLTGGHRQVAASTYVSPSNQSFTNGTPLFGIQGWDATNVRRGDDGAYVTVASNAFGGAITPMRINSRGDAVFVGQNKRCAFAMMLVGNGGSQLQYESIRTIYKATLGLGLGLP